MVVNKRDTKKNTSKTQLQKGVRKRRARLVITCD